MQKIKKCEVCKKELSEYVIRCTPECSRIIQKRTIRRWKIADYKKMIKAYFNHIYGSWIIFIEAFNRKPLPYRDYIPTEVADKSKKLSSKSRPEHNAIQKVGSIGEGLDIEVDGKRIKSEGTVWYEG